MDDYSELRKFYVSAPINEAILDYLESVQLARSKNTADTYKHALNAYEHELAKNNVSLLSELSEETIAWFATSLKGQSTATESLYLQAVMNFFAYLATMETIPVNLSRLDMIKKQRARRLGIRLPQFPEEDIERLLAAVIDTKLIDLSKTELLRVLRDKAFVLTLADTGLRVHEACKLQRGDIDWREGRAVIIGKGDKQAVVRFSSRALDALKEYLTARASLDGGSVKPIRNYLKRCFEPIFGTKA